jgi:hypothetical protein
MTDHLRHVSHAWPGWEQEPGSPHRKLGFVIPQFEIEQVTNSKHHLQSDVPGSVTLGSYEAQEPVDSSRSGAGHSSKTPPPLSPPRQARPAFQPQ